MYLQPFDSFQAYVLACSWGNTDLSFGHPRTGAKIKREQQQLTIMAGSKNSKLYHKDMFAFLICFFFLFNFAGYTAGKRLGFQTDLNMV